MAKRAMTSENASQVKTAGHENEHHFAAVIGGQVNLGSHTDKKDVVDGQHRSHSVKAGTWWQVFLYGEERLKTNTIFQGLGDVANIMVDCINAYPIEYDDYTADKNLAKQRLRPHMRALLAELEKPAVFRAFLDKALFDGGQADYLSLYPGAAKTPEGHKHFHTFHKTDVIDALSKDITLANSQATRKGTTPEQKVVFRSALHQKQVGEIEDRHDSRGHYREMKFRLNGLLVFEILRSHCVHPKPQNKRARLTCYGRSVALFK